MKRTKFPALFLVILMVPCVSANMGIPVIFVTMPLMLLALLPIILIESLVLMRYLAKGLKRTIVPVGIANAVTTILGYPISWGLLFGIGLITTGGSCGPGFDTVGKSILTVLLEAAWLCPWEEQIYWTLPIAIIIGLLLAFFISILIEYKILKRYFKNLEPKPVWVANMITYGLLVLFSLIYLLVGIIG
ncbi:MAG: hypothetical protein ACLFP2_05125 [Candidatus Woesearchaeota archaeon]